MIRDRAKELARLYSEHAPREEHGGAANGHKPRAVSSKSDEEVIEKICSERGGKFERLMRGDLSDYNGDHSRADDAFVHKLWSYTQDPEQVKRIHAMSGLHRPEKSGQRFDYLERSIRRAEREVTWFYEWPEKTFKVGMGEAEDHSAVLEMQFRQKEKFAFARLGKWPPQPLPRHCGSRTPTLPAAPSPRLTARSRPAERLPGSLIWRRVSWKAHRSWESLRQSRGCSSSQSSSQRASERFWSVPV